MNNPSQQTAPNVWLALEKGASGITIDSVVLKPSNVVLTPNAYGAGKSWYQASAAGIAKGVNQMARIYFKYTSCSLDSIKLSAGWNCSGYPVPDPAASPCNIQSLYLKIDPLPSRIQLSMGRQPTAPSAALCEEDSVTIIVNSAQAANVVDPVITIPVPAGMTITTPVQVEYPLGSGTWQNVTPVVSGSIYTVNLSSHSGIGINGLPGTVSSSGAANRQAKIRIAYNTSCDFVSGNLIPFIATGKRPCTGLSALGSGNITYSNPVKITGAGVTGTTVVNLTLSSASLACGDTATLSSTVIPVMDPIISGDSVVYSLPAGLGYAGKFTNISGCSSCGVSTLPGSLGSTIVKIGLTPGITAGTNIDYTFAVRMVPAVGCDTLSITGQAERLIPGLNCGATVCSNNKVVIGSATPASVALSKPDITITSLAVSGGTQWVAGQVQNVMIGYQNSGSLALPANTYRVELFCGVSTTPFATKIISKAISSGASVIDTYAVYISKSSCTAGDLVTAKVQMTTDSGRQQCLCAPASYQLAGVPLPLQFISYSAAAAHCLVTLNWEYNQAGQSLSAFAIERSADGASYTQVGRVSPDMQQYADITPHDGSWFYRINAIDTRGKSGYTPVMKVHTSTCTEASVRVYPNPVRSELNVFLQGAAATSFSIVDVLGRTVRQGVLQPEENKLDLSSVATGVYQLRVTVNGNTLTYPVSVSR